VGAVVLLTGRFVMAEDEAKTEGFWPRDVTLSNAVVTIYQPQLEKLDGNRLDARLAVAVTKKGSQEPSYCAVRITSALDINKSTRMVKLRDLQVTKIAAPETSDSVKDKIKNVVRQTILGADLSFSLDRLVAMMHVTEKQQANIAKFDNSVPRIFFATKPSVLVYIDGEPRWQDAGSGVKRVLNSQYLILKDESNQRIYLRCAGRWFSSTSLTEGWKIAPSVPGEMTNILKKEDSDAEDITDDTIPQVFVSTQPAELVQSYGEPKIGTIPDTQLSYLKNSDNDLFRDENSGRLYLLISGRWFSAATTEGPWEYVAPDRLPADFRAIPKDSSRADVLASVSGTPEAQDAVMESYIPQTATLKRGPSDIAVEYDGQPDFEPVKSTKLRYAINTDSQVIEYDGKYYLCSDGAWYVSKSPQGPWNVCTEVPEEIYNIPPENPLYNTTYVNVYDYDDDYVRCGYFPGYLNSFVCGGIIVYGTGCHYRWWVRYHCYPRYVTYGHRCRYHRWNCRWYRYDRYRDRQGKYVAWNAVRQHREARGLPVPPRASGDYRRRRVQAAVAAGGTAGLYNIYKRNKNTISTAKKAHQLRRRAASTAKGGKFKTRPVKRPNNVYVGKDGKIYRHGINGWQQRDNKKWQSVKGPSGKPVIDRPVSRPVVGRPSKRPAARPSVQPVKRPAKLPEGISIIPPGQSRPTVKPSIRPASRPAARPASRPASRPAARPTHRPVNNTPVSRDLKRQYQSRQHGSYRTNSARRHSSSSRSVNRSAVRARAASRGGGRRR
jgi:hypothetical protein